MKNIQPYRQELPYFGLLIRSVVIRKVTYINYTTAVAGASVRARAASSDGSWAAVGVPHSDVRRLASCDHIDRSRARC